MVEGSVDWHEYRVKWQREEEEEGPIGTLDYYGIALLKITAPSWNGQVDLAFRVFTYIYSA